MEVIGQNDEICAPGHECISAQRLPCLLYFSTGFEQTSAEGPAWTAKQRCSTGLRERRARRRARLSS